MLLTAALRTAAKEALTFFLYILFTGRFESEDGRLPGLYYYPRLCIVRWKDHQHAAFYPPVEELEKTEDVEQRLRSITKTEILDFVSTYLRDQDAMMQRTEIF